MLQTDGNLVLDGPQKQYMWAFDTAGNLAICSAFMQNDGSMVVRHAHSKPAN
jgi:hypothetical protein